MSGIIEIEKESELDSVAEKIKGYLQEYKILCFYGPMGAGKTTLIKAICKKLNVRDNVTSPTFSIVNEYITEDGKKLFHFDFYRIKDKTEALDMGYEEYFYSGEICMVEWPEMIEEFLPKNILKIEIKETQGKRRINIQS
jgi:tRNA threonylcarbamoyladenosine biosynthesis protein TsaE